jgi:TRAP-type C4-dicarboxylate transport system permease large subunit
LAGNGAVFSGYGGYLWRCFHPDGSGRGWRFWRDPYCVFNATGKSGNFVTASYEALKVIGMIFLLIIGAFIFAHFLAMTRLPFFLSDMVVASSPNRYIVLGVIILLYIILGMFLDIHSCIVLTIPIFFPTIQAFGFNTIWYGVIMVRIIEIGLITPPIGMNAFMLSGVSKTPINTIFKGIIPFFIADLIHVGLLLAFPAVALWLPNTMFS